MNVVVVLVETCGKLQVFFVLLFVEDVAVLLVVGLLVAVAADPVAASC